MIRLTGICGGIGAGKSVVARICRVRNYPLYDCDARARVIMENSDEVREFLEKKIPGSVSSGGNIDRTAVSRSIFGNEALRLELNRLVHSLVRADLRRWIKILGDKAVCGGRAFVESAILASSGLADMCDDIWMVTAPEDVRVKRVMERSALPEAEIRQRMAAQREEMALTENCGVPVSIIVNASDSAILSRIDSLLELR